MECEMLSITPAHNIQYVSVWSLLTRILETHIRVAAFEAVGF